MGGVIVLWDGELVGVMVGVTLVLGDLECLKCGKIKDEDAEQAG